MNHRNFTEEENKNILFRLNIAASLITLGIVMLTIGIYQDIGIYQEKAGGVWLMPLGSMFLGYGVFSAVSAIGMTIKAAARLVARALDDKVDEKVDEKVETTLG